MRTGPRKGHKRYFYGDRSQEQYLLWGIVLEKVLFLRIGPQENQIDWEARCITPKKYSAQGTSSRAVAPPQKHPISLK